MSPDTGPPPRLTAWLILRAIGALILAAILAVLYYSWPVIWSILKLVTWPAWGPAWFFYKLGTDPP